MEPGINIIMYLVIAVAKLPRRHALFGGPGLRGSTVFIGSAYIKGLISPDAAKPGKNIRRKHLD
jgi:hypothetical protein